MNTIVVVDQCKLMAFRLWFGACCSLLAATAFAQGPGHADGTLDVTFGFGTTLDRNSPPADGTTNYGKILTTDVLGNTVAAGVGNLAWTATATAVSLQGTSFGSAVSKGVFHQETFGSGNGKIKFESNTISQTYGTSSLPNPNGTNRGTFHDSVFTSGDLGADVTGVVGFVSSAGNWGYIEFDWIEAASELTVLSARVQRFTGQPITFTPSVGASFAVPEPCSLLLFSVGSALLLVRGYRQRSA